MRGSDTYFINSKWPPHVIEEWNTKLESDWGSEVKRVRLAIFALRRFGIWYYDAKPGNVMVENWNSRLEE